MEIDYRKKKTIFCRCFVSLWSEEINNHCTIVAEGPTHELTPLHAK
jgi:hypothetical protein